MKTPLLSLINVKYHSISLTFPEILGNTKTRPPDEVTTHRADDLPHLITKVSDMTDDDVTRFDPVRLPPSPKELMDFDCLAFTEQRIGESVYIEPPSDWTVYGPEGDLFDYPIQVTVLGIEGERVQLGVHRHMSLRLLQGPPPGKAWRADYLCGMQRPEDTLPSLHTGTIASGFTIVGNTLYIDDVRAFDGYLGVPEELLSEYRESDREPWEQYTYGPHPDFSYVLVDTEDRTTVPGYSATIELRVVQKRYIVYVENTASMVKSSAVRKAERFLPEYAANLKEFLETYHIAWVKQTLRWER